MANHNDNIENSESFRDRLSKVYKLVIIDEETLGQSGSFTGSYSTYLVYIGIVLMVTSILTTCLISFTPIRRLVPGYGDIEENTKYKELKVKIAELEAGVEVQQTYINGLQKIFAGEVDESEIPETLLFDNQPKTRNTEIVTEDDRMALKTAKGLSKLYFTSPVQGSISAKYDVSISHYGVDVLAAKGVAIKAIAPGMVINSDWSLDAGNTLSIQHGNNTISVYKHNSALLKETGEYVKAGEAVAIIGNTGTLSDGPHLHFELWYDGTPVDPENYITF